MVELAIVPTPAAVRVDPRGEDEVLTAMDSCTPKDGEVMDDSMIIELDDMEEAITMLQQARIIMSCLADPELTPKIMKTHREALERLVDKIEKFLEYAEED